MLCRELSLVKQNSTHGIAIPLVCRSWGCDYCAPRRRRELVNLATSGKPNRFITLTCSPKVGVSPADRAKQLARAWRVTVARARRQLGMKDIEYLAVFEATKAGEPHLHILCRCDFIPQRWLSAQMQSILKSPIVDIRLIKTLTHTARYVAKYVGKEPHHFATCKRYWQTRGWAITEQFRGPGEKDTSGEWRVDQRSLADILHDWTKEHKHPKPYFPFWLPGGALRELGEVSWGEAPAPQPDSRSFMVSARSPWPSRGSGA